MIRLLTCLFFIFILGFTPTAGAVKKDLNKIEVKKIITNIEKEISILLAEIKKKKENSKDCKDSRGHSEKCNKIGATETSIIKQLVLEKESYERIYKIKTVKKQEDQKSNIKDKVLKEIDNLSRNYDYHFFAHTTAGEQFWGSTINKSAFLQV